MIKENDIKAERAHGILKEGNPCVNVNMVLVIH